MALSACATDGYGPYGYGGYGGYRGYGGYNAYYGGGYRPFYDGDWGRRGTYYYAPGRHRYFRDDGRHFRRGPDGGYHHGRRHGDRDGDGDGFHRH
ncbi:hypothetical protein DJ021_04030 [Phenylobacterium hankyongense]|uniref:Uncharacterized protein n=1 Tax=Phenylobacterium hankyongense TaxID=1813876 RepID=A0A328AVD7_9CAUL|nr:hypothetical protein DJ021_04030 [Phenylobacterium hankyongense]